MDTPNTSQQYTPQRGALLVTVTPSTPTLSAGSSFSIAVSITNPFDIPITLGGVSTRLPVDLYDVALATRRAEQERAQRQIENARNDLLRRLGGRVVPRTQMRGGKMRPFIRMVFGLVPGFDFLPIDDLVDLTSMAVAQAAEVEWGRPSWNRLAEGLAQMVEEPQIVTEEALTEEQIQTKVDELLRPMQEEAQRLYERQIEQPIVLQPGDSTAKVFTLRTRRGLLFNPASHNLNILISYEADRVTHTQTIPYALDIQAHLMFMIIGALGGSLLGVLASTPNVLEWQLAVILPKALSALVLSAFAVIAFARKEGIQPVIAVQDFWGGLLIGFLVGYSGIQVLGDVFGQAGEGG